MGKKKSHQDRGEVSVNHGNRNDDSACSSANREGTTGRGCAPQREWVWRAKVTVGT